MKADRSSESYFEKLPDNPLFLKPFEPENKSNAKADGNQWIPSGEKITLSQ
jgi:hypothetical protein